MFISLTFLSSQCTTQCWRDSGDGDRVDSGDHDSVIVAASHHGLGQDDILEHESVLAHSRVTLLDLVHAEAGGGSGGVVGGLNVGIVLADLASTCVGSN